MRIEASTIDAYLPALPDDRREALQQLLRENLPEGFDEQMRYGMPGFVVPLSLYPPGYHCAPDTPLPFISYASQKNFVALYHMGIYADSELLNWFTDQFPKHSSRKLYRGKHCTRFKHIASSPYALIGDLAQKMTPQVWINLYEDGIR